MGQSIPESRARCWPRFSGSRTSGASLWAYSASIYCSSAGWRSPLVSFSDSSVFLVVIAGAGYLADFLGGLLSTRYAIEVATFTFVGDVVLMVWLLVFAVRSRFQFK
jgi:hypothetical protein